LQGLQFTVHPRHGRHTRTQVQVRGVQGMGLCEPLVKGRGHEQWGLLQSHHG
jgi:hypothetical protein